MAVKSQLTSPAAAESPPPKILTPESPEVWSRAVSAEREKRCYVVGLELRSAADGRGPGTAVGYAAVFSKLSVDLGGFREQIRPGAFTDVLSQDVRALKNHDANYLLGRTKSRTLRLFEDVLGLRVEIDLPDTSTGRDVAYDIDRGDMDGMSFAFVVGSDKWDYDSDPIIRTIERVSELYDVGPVAFPAYTDTSIAMRSLNSNRPQPATSPVEPFVPLSVYQARLRIAGAC
jgi:uncharacterized protein